MRLKKICLSLGCLLLAPFATAQAADWNNGAGGLKDYRSAGVPIPAPIPYAESFKWYLRADIGGGWSSNPDHRESGMIYGLDSLPLQPFGMRSSWFQSGFDTFATGGVGVGLYITPRLRTDVTVDVRTKSTIEARGNYSYVGNDALIGNPPGGGDTWRVDGETSDTTEVRGTVGLVNLYWDLVDRSNRFVPYVGAGAGFVVRTVDRRHTTGETAFQTTGGNDTLFGLRNFTGQTKAHPLAPAFAAMAGFGYNISTGMVLDFNYRYTYLGEVDFSVPVSFTSPVNGRTGATSKLTIGDTHEHAIRAGVRWNVW